MRKPNGEPIEAPTETHSLYNEERTYTEEGVYISERASAWAEDMFRQFYYQAGANPREVYLAILDGVGMAFVVAELDFMQPEK